MAKIWSNNIRATLAIALMSGGLAAASLDVAVPAASAATSVTLFVTPTGSGAACSQSAPCGVIQTAVNTAVANDVGDDVTIDVAAGSYAENDSISASRLHSLTIAGAGAQASAVNGGAVNSVFLVLSGDVTISGLIVQNGDAGANGGGGIDNDASLTVVDSLLTGDSSSSSGGAIFNHAGATLQMSDSTVSGNTAAVGGGGVENAGVLTVTSSNLTNNTTSQNTDAAGYGGAGIENSGTATVDDGTFSANMSAVVGGAIRNDGRLQIGNSTMTTNSSPIAGGGIWNGGSTVLYNSTVEENSTSGSGGGIETTGSIAVTASTFWGNTATQDGGGIENDNGTMSLKNSTVYDNSASAGGAIDNVGNTANVVLAQSTVSDNSGPAIDDQAMMSTIGSIVASNHSGPDCAGDGSVSDLGYNLTDDTSCGLAAATDVSANPDLGVLALNGGTTATALPGTGSSAIHAIPTGTAIDQFQLCPRVDQRGISSVGTCTIGAAEGGFLITTTSLPDATSGSAFGPVTLIVQSARASTWPYTTSIAWGAVGLPNWLTLTPEGSLSGTPQQTGRFSFTVIVSETVRTLKGSKLIKTEKSVSARLSLKVLTPSPTPLEFVPQVPQFPTFTVREYPYPPVDGRPSGCVAGMEALDFASIIGGVAPYRISFSASPPIFFDGHLSPQVKDENGQLTFAAPAGGLYIDSTPGDEPVENSVITFTATDATGASTSVSVPWTIDNPDGITGCET